MGTVRVASEAIPSKTLSCMANGVRISEVTFFRLEQFLNALSAMEVTLTGMVIAKRLVQSSNAEPPMDVRPLPKDTEVRPVQSSKAELPIDVTLPDIYKEVRLLHL